MNTKRSVTIVQPGYIPWVPFFARCRLADLTVFLDDVQMEKNSLINRNRICCDGSTRWLTIPIDWKGHLKKTIREMSVAHSSWTERHANQLSDCYRGSPGIDMALDLVRGLDLRSSLFIEPAEKMIRRISSECDLDIAIVESSTLRVEKKKSALVLGICEELNACEYISGPLGRNYLDLEAFRKRGIRVKFTDEVLRPQSHNFSVMHDVALTGSWSEVRQRVLKLL